MTNAALNICPCSCTCGPSCDHRTCPCNECKQARGEVLATVAKIHEEDFMVLQGDEARAMASKIRDLMYFYSYNRQGSDYLCVFCQERGQSPNDQITHRDCDGEKFLAILEK